MYKFTLLFFQLLVVPLAATMFHTIDTTSPLLCTFSSRFQNRVIVEKSKIQKVIAVDEERLSIFMEELSGQAFICARDLDLAETTLSVVTEKGLVQDLQVTFIERLPEVVILTDPTLEKQQIQEQEEFQEKLTESHVFAKVADLLVGHIPQGYVPCQIQHMHWQLKKGIVLEALARLEGADDILTLYQITNTLNKQCALSEYELQSQGCCWVFLENNSLFPKQKMLGVIAVKK
jgi:hypothetical protein